MRPFRKVYWVDDSWEKIDNQAETIIHEVLKDVCELFAVAQLAHLKSSRVYHLGNSSRSFTSDRDRSKFHFLSDCGHMPYDEKYEICCTHRIWAPGCIFDASLVIVDGDLGDGDYSELGQSGRFIKNVLIPECIPYLRYSGASSERISPTLHGLQYIQKNNIQDLAQAIVSHGFK